MRTLATLQMIFASLCINTSNVPTLSIPTFLFHRRPCLRHILLSAASTRVIPSHTRLFGRALPGNPSTEVAQLSIDACGRVPSTHPPSSHSTTSPISDVIFSLSCVYMQRFGLACIVGIDQFACLLSRSTTLKCVSLHVYKGTKKIPSGQVDFETYPFLSPSSSLQYQCVSSRHLLLAIRKKIEIHRENIHESYLLPVDVHYFNVPRLTGFLFAGLQQERPSPNRYTVEL